MISIRLSNNEDSRFIDVYPLEDMTLPLPTISETLQHQELSCSFKLQYDADVFDYVMSYNELQAVVYDGMTPVFTGRIKNEITWVDNGYPLPVDSISLTINDNSYLFAQKTETEFAQINKTLSYIVEEICNQCGATIAESEELRDITVQAFVLDSNKTYSEALNNLLFQYGYAYYFNGAGEVCFVDLYSVPELKQSITENELFTGLEVKRSLKNYTGVRLKYNTLTKKENEQVYFEGNGLNEDNQVTPITVRPGQYYPYESDPIQEEREGQIFQTFEDGYAESYQTYSGEQKFRRSQKTSLVYTENHQVVQDWEGSLVLNRTQFGARQASVRFLNTGNVDANLYQLAIRADAYYRTQEIAVSAGDLKNPYEYESEYIYGSDAADDFIEFLSRFFMGGNFKVTGKASAALQVGTHVSVDTGLSGFTCNAIVLSCEKDCKNNIYKFSLLQYGQAALVTQRYKTYASNYGKFSEQQVFPRSISSIVEEYYLSTSAVAVQGGSWQTTAPAWEQGKYIWTRTRINYNSGDSYVTDPLRSTALDNVGVDSVDIEYAQTDNAIDAPEEGWSTTAPQWQQGMFVWSRTKTILTDGSILYSNPACITGAKGEMGTAIKYLGLFDHLPENANEGEFILAKSDFTSSENLQLINGNKLKLISGNYLSLLRSYTAGYIYVKSSKDYWWRVDDKNDYRYLLASNDLLEMGWSLSTNLQEELDDIEESAKEYTDSEIESLSQEVDVKVQNAPHYLGPSAVVPAVANIGDWYLNTTLGLLYKKEADNWSEVSEYTTENAYMYNAAAKDCLALAAANGNVASFALAFIASLKTYSVEFQNYVASMQNVQTRPGDQIISMGLNPKDSDDPTFNFLIQRCINKLPNNEIWTKELYSEQNENGNLNLKVTGKLQANNGIETTGDLWSGTNVEEPDVVFSGANFSLRNYTGGTVYLNGVYYAFQAGGGQAEIVYVWQSLDGKNFSRITVEEISITFITDIIAFKNHILIATGNGLYEFLPASTSFALVHSSTAIKEFCNINDELLICPTNYNAQLVSTDGVTFSQKSQFLGYHLSQFSKDLWIGSPQYSNTMTWKGYFILLRYANKTFENDAFIEIPGQKVVIDNIQYTIALAGQVYAANGCIYASLETSDGKILLGKSADCGQTWTKVDIPNVSLRNFVVAFKGFDYEGVIILYTESAILISNNGGTDWQYYSFGGFSTNLPVSPYIVQSKNRKTVRIHTANSGNRLKLVDLVQYRAFGTGHGIEKQIINSSDFEIEYSNSFDLQGGVVNVGSNPTRVDFKTPFKKILALQVTPYDQPTNNATDTNYVCTPINITTAGFDLRYKDSDGTSDRVGLVSWTCYGLI